MADIANNAPTSPTTFSRWIPSLPTILNPFANADATPKEDEQSTTASNGLVKRPTGLSTISFNDSGHSGPPSPSRSSFFAEPSPSSNQSDRGGSPEGSVDGKRSKKSRPKTNYSVCHPPPESKARQKLHRRPRSLLQLHRVSEQRRPLPAYDVIPSANFSMRMHSAVGKVFRSRHGLCPNDLVVLQAENYSNGDEDENDQEARNVIGMICKGGRGGKDKDESVTAGRKLPRVLMAASGEEWESKTLANGGYEFFCPDSHGLGQTIRWIPKRNKDGSTVGRDGTRKFNFSTISPNTRRHPVIASLSKTALDINDTYKLPDPAGGTPLGTPQRSAANLLDDDEDPIDSTQQIFTPDQPLRDLITLTAIWVTFKEGWSASLKFDEVLPSAPGSPSKPSYSHGHAPSLTSLNSQPGSPGLSSGFAGSDKRSNSMKAFSSDLMRKTSLLGKDRNKRNSATAASDDGADASRNTSVATAVQTGRSRADSSSTVLVHRAASNRRRNNQLKEMVEGNSGTLEEVSSKREDDRRTGREDQGDSESESESEDDEEASEDARRRERKVSTDQSKSRGGSGSGSEGAGAPAVVQASTAPHATNGSNRGRKKEVVRMKDGGAVKASGKQKGWKRLLCGLAK
ncbi:unnamed protein product [Zymoseptoria tritici ST99CH_1E4]|nr:unnamed protein product [Zymoseptoria tritici ST99CH_1E4]